MRTARFKNKKRKIFIPTFLWLRKECKRIVYYGYLRPLMTSEKFYWKKKPDHSQNVFDKKSLPNIEYIFIATYRSQAYNLM